MAILCRRWIQYYFPGVQIADADQSCLYVLQIDAMRLIITIFLLSFVLGACAQVPVIQRGSAAQVTLDQRWMGGMNMYPPRVLGKPTLRPSQQNGGVDTLGAMVFNILDSSFYKWIGGNVWEKD